MSVLEDRGSSRRQYIGLGGVIQHSLLLGSYRRFASYLPRSAVASAAEAPRLVI